MRRFVSMTQHGLSNHLRALVSRRHSCLLPQRPLHHLVYPCRENVVATIYRPFPIIHIVRVENIIFVFFFGRFLLLVLFHFNPKTLSAPDASSPANLIIFLLRCAQSIYLHIRLFWHSACAYIKLLAHQIVAIEFNYVNRISFMSL